MSSDYDYDALARDLIARTERAVEEICRTAVDTGITFNVDDIVQLVEDHLPRDYPAPKQEGVEGRRAMIRQMAQDILDGTMYDEGG